MKFLVEIEGPETVEPAPGEPQLMAEVQIFILRWIQQSSRFRMVARPVVTVQRLDFDVVPVKADALLRLQKRATVLQAIAARKYPHWTLIVEAAKEALNEP